MNKTLLHKILRLICLVTSLFTVGCRQAPFDANWSNDPGTWKEHLLNGVQVRIPSELPRVQMNPGSWIFVIKAQQADDFSQGVRQAVRITVHLRTELLPEEVIKRQAQNIESLGGRTRAVQAPVMGMQFFLPDRYEGRKTKGNELKEAVIGGSSFGYFFISSNGAPVWVRMFIDPHPPVSYESWKPETEFFSEPERKLVEAIAASVK